MGYCQQVKVAIEFRSVEDRTAFIVTTKLTATPAMLEHIEAWQTPEDKSYIRFEEGDWRGPFPDEALQDLLDKSTDAGGAYAYVRIGEDYSDPIEESSAYHPTEANNLDPWAHFDVIREVVWRDD